MPAFDHLLSLNARLIGALEGATDDLPDGTDLAELLAAREVFFNAVKRSPEKAPAELRALLLEQHRRLDTLLETWSGRVTTEMQRLDKLENAQAQYATPQSRQVLPSRLNV